jgi:hypothetical protein
MARTKEQQIVSQSSLKLALEWSNTCGKCLSTYDLCATSRVIEDYVENGFTTEVGDRLKNLDEYLNKKYTK